jgi:hypothetical protein
MLGIQAPPQRRRKDEGEKPFWISFSDLMSALMVLFLVVMSVALLAVTKKISDDEREEKQRASDISELMKVIQQVANQFEGVRIVGTTIDFGPRGNFEREGQNTLSAPQRDLLREFTPRLIKELRTNEGGRRWFKRAVVEGYASQTGSYLFNLNLSLERSERVLCELLRDPAGVEPLPIEDRRLIAQRFFVGGASFNSLRTNAAESRRIEFKLEFKSRDELKRDEANPPTEVDLSILDRALDPKERCPILDR